MSPAEELARLRGEAGEREAPPDLDTIEVEAEDPPAALARVREALEVVLRHQEGEWPSLDEWKARLPSWFVAACVDDREVKNCILDRWSLRAWLHWLRPEQRRWRWWDAAARDGSLRVRLAPLEHPYLRGSLDWLLEVARGGAE